MHRNVARAYNALWAEHKRVRVAWMKILAQGDRTLERKLLRADLEDLKHHDEVLRYEERLSRPQWRRVLQGEELCRRRRQRSSGVSAGKIVLGCSNKTGVESAATAGTVFAVR